MATTQNMTSRLLASLLLALGIAASGYFIGAGIRYFRNFDRYVEVKGLAEQTVKSDLATWNIGYSVSGENLQQLYQQISRNQQTVVSFLQTNGFQAAEVQIGSINVTDNWANNYGGNNAKLAHYQISASVSVTSNAVDRVARVSQSAGSLVNQGVVVTSNSISYFYNGLNQIKNHMLDQATRNAKEAAATFAHNAQSQVGQIKTANQGVFTITSPDGAVVGDTSNIYKKVRVVTSVQFFLQ